MSYDSRRKYGWDYSTRVNNYGGSLNFPGQKDYLGNMYGWDEVKRKKEIIPYRVKRYFKYNWFALLWVFGCAVVIYKLLKK